MFPNGVVLSADGDTLIVAETFAQRLPRSMSRRTRRSRGGACSRAAGSRARWHLHRSRRRDLGRRRRGKSCVRVKDGGEIIETVTTRAALLRLRAGRRRWAYAVSVHRRRLRPGVDGQAHRCDRANAGRRTGRGIGGLRGGDPRGERVGKYACGTAASSPRKHNRRNGLLSRGGAAPVRQTLRGTRLAVLTFGERSCAKVCHRTVPYDAERSVGGGDRQSTWRRDLVCPHREARSWSDGIRRGNCPVESN